MPSECPKYQHENLSKQSLTRHGMPLSVFLLTVSIFVVSAFFPSCKPGKAQEYAVYRLIDHFTEENIVKTPLSGLLEKFILINQDLSQEWKPLLPFTDENRDVWAAAAEAPLLGEDDTKKPEGMKILIGDIEIPFGVAGETFPEYWTWHRTRIRKIDMSRYDQFRHRYQGVVLNAGKKFILKEVLPGEFLVVDFRLSRARISPASRLAVYFNGKLEDKIMPEANKRLRIKGAAHFGENSIEFRLLPGGGPIGGSERDFIVISTITLSAPTDLILLSTPKGQKPPQGAYSAVYYSAYESRGKRLKREQQMVLPVYRSKDTFPLKDLGTAKSSFPLLKKAQINDHSFSSFYAPPETHYVFPLKVHENSTFEFGYGFLMERPRESDVKVRFRVEIEHGQNRETVFSEDFGAGIKNTFRTQAVGLEAFAKKNITLHLITESLPLPEKIRPNFMNFNALWINPLIYRRGTPPKVNVILVSLDTLRADHVGSYGYDRETSPNIDKLAKEGVLFERPFSTTSWTLPAHVSMLTSLNADSHKAVTFFSKLSGKLITLPDIMRNNGYTCGALTGGNYVSIKYGFDKGFDYYREIRYSGDLAVRYDEAETLFKWTDGWLTKNQDRPFFLFIHTYQPHSPYRNRSDLGKMFLGEGAKWLSVRMKDILEEKERFRAEFSDAEIRNIIDLYDGEIRYTDEALIKPLVEKLKALGLYDNTLLIVTSDHGEEFYEHQGWTHNTTLYNELIHIPLIIKFPRSAYAGQRIPYVCTINDIMPTVLETAGIDISPFKFDGQSLYPFIRGEETQDRAFFCDLFQDLGPKMFATNKGGHKLIWNKKLVSPYTKKTAWDFFGEMIELYDMDADFTEMTNIASQKKFEDLIKELMDRLASFSEFKADGEAVEIDEELKENLRALGYIK